MDTTRQTGRAITTLIAVFAALLLTGCPPKTEKAVPDENTHAMSDAANHTYPIDIDALAELLTPVTADMHWGLVKVDNQITALRALALTSDDRTVEIRAQYAADGIDVQVKVGHFGDAEAEQKFHDTLRKQAQSRK